MTEIYNTFSNECKNNALESDMMNILREEHNIGSTVFTEAEKRGWQTPEAAPQPKVEAVKTKYQNLQNTLRVTEGEKSLINQAFQLPLSRAMRDSR